MTWNELLKKINTDTFPPRRVEKTNEEWKMLLTPEQFQITRQHATERAFSGEYCESYTPGIYKCVCCETELFDSTLKFNARSGWPSFTGPVNENVIKYISNTTYGTQEVEVVCSVCDAQLGHVFP